MEYYYYCASVLGAEDDGAVGGLRATRLSVLLNSALGVVARGQGGSSAFIDLDSLPEGALGVGASLRFLLGKSAGSLRALLVEEAVGAADVVIRQAGRRAFAQLSSRLASRLRPSLPFFGRLSILPDPETTSVPFLIPKKAPARKGEEGVEAAVEVTAERNMSAIDRVNSFRRKVDGVAPVLTSPRDVVDRLFPKLSREEELYAIALGDLCAQSLGPDVARVMKGEILLEPSTLPKLLFQISKAASSARGGQDALSLLLQRVNPDVGVRENILQLVQGRSERTGAPSVKSGGGGGDQGMDELVTALSDLNGDETATLQETLSTIGGQLVDSALDRLQPLLPPQTIVNKQF